MNNRFLGQNGFKGVDFSSHPSMVNPDRLSDCKNMWRDYSSGQGSAIESFPGYRAIATSLNGKIYGIFRYKVGSADYLLVHGGTHLYACLLSEIDDWSNKKVDISVATSVAMSAHESKGFQYGINFYIIDGTHYFKLSYADDFSISDCGSPYIPCTYINGSEYEQRNMLTNQFTEKYTVYDIESMYTGTEGLEFEITDSVAKKCKVTGISSLVTFAGVLFIPERTVIESGTYTVNEIDAYAFRNEQRIAVVVMPNTIETMGDYAFSSCLALTKVYLSSGLTTIANYAFRNCTSLKYLYFPKSITSIGTNAFQGCSLARVYYSGTTAEYNAITGTKPTSTNLWDEVVSYDTERAIALYIHEKCQSVQTVKCDGVTIMDNQVYVTTDASLSSSKTYWDYYGVKEYINGINFAHGSTKVLTRIKVESMLGYSTSGITITISNFATLFANMPLGEKAIFYLGYGQWKLVNKGGTDVTTNDITASYGITVTGTLQDEDTYITLTTTGISNVYEKTNETKYFSTIQEDDNITKIIIYSTNKAELIGAEIEINATAHEGKFSSSKYAAWKQTDEISTSLNAVKKCTLTAQFDGRIFMTGNPDLPNTVFYSQRDLTGHNNPMYFGTYNFFDTGVGLSPNTALFSAGNVLAVLKSDTIQDGSINLYTGVDGTDDILPRIYVRSQGLPGLGCVGAAVNFADDPVFITQRGLDAIGTQTVNLERTIQHRSSNVDRRLIAEDLSNSKLTEWQGYLILLVPGGKAYIADSRQRYTSQSGTMEYEWYFIDDIGSYSGDWDMYAYCSALPPDSESFEIEGHGFTLHPNPDMPVESYYAVSSMTVGLTEFHYVVLGDMENPIYYPCYNTGEKIGGTFSPASAISGIGDLLIFGTESGYVCVVNTDKRGTKPTGYDEITDAEYKQSYADIIPREWYTHMNHKYDFYLALAQENAGVPHLTKNTIKKSAVIKAKDMYGSVFYYNVKTDREAFGEAPLIAANMADFSDTDLSSYVFDTSNDGAIIVIGERKKKWVEKQYAFFSNDYCRPFGIYNISYQYEIQGRVKNR